MYIQNEKHKKKVLQQQHHFSIKVARHTNKIQFIILKINKNVAYVCFGMENIYKTYKMENKSWEF